MKTPGITAWWLAAMLPVWAVAAEPAAGGAAPQTSAAADGQARRELDAALGAFTQAYHGVIAWARTDYPSVEKRLIPAYIFSPPAVGATTTRPGLIILHGSNHGHFGPEYFDLIARAVAEHYVVIFPEYRGSGGYGIEHYDAIDYGGKEIDDALAAADVLIRSRPDVDPARLVLYGYSHGGLIVLGSIARAPRRFRAAVHMNGLVDLVAYMAAKSPEQQREIARQPSFHGQLPYENLAPYIAASPLRDVDRIETPLLIIATTSDAHVRPALHAERLFDALKARGKPCEYWLCADAPGGHTFTYQDSPARREAFDRVFSFFAQQLHATSP
jgi:dipeptidyl aminopeptidase/acylaminoacyl peptidase